MGAGLDFGAMKLFQNQIEVVVAGCGQSHWTAHFHMVNIMSRELYLIDTNRAEHKTWWDDGKQTCWWVGVGCGGLSPDPVGQSGCWEGERQRGQAPGQVGRRGSCWPCLCSHSSEVLPRPPASARAALSPLLPDLAECPGR